MAASVGPLAGRPGPVAVVGMPVRVVVPVVPVGTVALLVHGAVVMVVVVVVAAVLGPAAVAVALLGRQVARLRGGAEVRAQPWRGDISVDFRKFKTIRDVSEET